VGVCNVLRHLRAKLTHCYEPTSHWAYDLLMLRKINFEGVKVIVTFLLCVLGLVCLWAYRIHKFVGNR
jgi:hypothetical protein